MHGGNARGNVMGRNCVRGFNKRRYNMYDERMTEVPSLVNGDLVMVEWFVKTGFS